MRNWHRLATGAVWTAVALAALWHSQPASAQGWADGNYRYRRPLTVYNAGTSAFAAGDIAAYSYIPGYDIYEGKGRLDGKDVKLYYYDGATNVAVPQVLLPMGNSAAKVLFATQKPIAASVPYLLTENTSAGKTPYASLPAGQKIAFDGSDDNDALITLPFTFPFKTGATNKLNVAVDGYAVPDGDPAGNYLRYDLDGLSGAVSKAFIAPWLSDFSIWGPTQGVWADLQPGQVTIRWEVQPTTGGEVKDTIAKFALILKPDGSMRFVYGNPCTQDQVSVGYSPPKYGVGAGDPAFSRVTEPGFEDYSDHADIFYTQAFGAPTESTGYWVYYGSGGDDGKTGRTAPPASKLVKYDFDDNTDQGWVPMIQGPTLAVSNGVMQLTAALGGDHPNAVAAGQTTVLGDQIVYARVRSSGGDNEMGLMARSGPNGEGYALLLDSYGTQELIVARTGDGQTHDYNIISNGVNYVASPNLWHFPVMKVAGSGPDTVIYGKAFNEIQTEPDNWSVTATVSADDMSDRRFDTGTLGFTFYGCNPYIDWIVACDPKAENTSGGTGAEQENPNLGYVTGRVTFAGGGLKDANVAFTPTAGGAALNVTTDAAGGYFVSMPGGSYNVAVTTVFTCFTPVSTTLSVVNAQTLTYNVELTAKDNLVENGSFEEEDSAFSGKPRGWFRNSYGGIVNPDDSNKDTDLLPWLYRKDMGRTGTHCIGFEGTTSNIQAWEVESSLPGVSASGTDADNRGGAPLLRLPPGATIQYSFWYKKATANGEVRHRPRYCSADALNTLIGGGASNATAAVAADWTKLEATYTNTDAGAQTVPNFLAYRIYGVSNPAGEPVYVDDVSVKLTAVGSTQPPKLYRGYVQDSQGNRLPNVVVGLGDGLTNALAAPYQTYYTDGVGRWQFTVSDFSKTWYVQARKYRLVGDGMANNICSPDIALPASADNPVVLTYDPAPAVNVALNSPLAVADASAAVDAPEHWAITTDSIITGPGIYEGRVIGGPTTITDNEIWSRVSVDGPDGPPGGRKYPRFWVIDLGREVTFGTGIKQVQLAHDPAPFQGFQVRVSKTAPPATFTGYSQMDFLTSPCLTWGTPVYISPNGVPKIGTAQTDPGDENRSFLQFEDSYQRVRTITKFLTNGDGSPVSGRYVMLLSVNSKWNVSPFDFRVETATGTITGKVVDTTGAPVADAYVGVHPDGLAYARTAADGTYTLAAPAPGPLTIQAHKAPAANTVFPLSSAETVVVAPGGAAVAPTLILGAAVANALPAGSGAYTDPASEEQPATNTVDGDLASRWVTTSFATGIVSEVTPLILNIDLGSAKTINQVVIHWENAYSYGYKVVVTNSSDPYATDTPVYETKWGTGGYVDGGRHVDTIQFPAKTGQYINIWTTVPGNIRDRVSIYEVQAASVTLPAPSPSRALRIAAGLETATSADVTALDVVKTGDSNGKVRIEDAVKLLRARSGL